MYDYLIVGAGPYGAIFAHEAKKRGYKVKIVEKRYHVGGNIYDEDVNGVRVHVYGAHIFHTSNKKIWRYMNEFTEFNHYINSPLANYHGEVYNLPFNMNTFSKMWNIATPEEARQIIEEQKRKHYVEHPKNLEEQAINLVGPDIYTKLIKGYTEKQWGRNATEIPSFIIRRLPVRFTYNNNYFNDIYQGIPLNGYTAMIKNIIGDIEVDLNTDFFAHRAKYEKEAKRILYTGPVDKFYNYVHGELEYRSLRFEHEYLNIDNYQGVAVVNYTAFEVPYTRIIEHKHFNFGTQPNTVITKEYATEWTIEDEPYYPINDEKNQARYSEYQKLMAAETKYIFGGRLADYKYYDMDKVVEAVLAHVEREFDGKNA